MLVLTQIEADSPELVNREAVLLHRGGDDGGADGEVGRMAGQAGQHVAMEVGALMGRQVPIETVDHALVPVSEKWRLATGFQNARWSRRRFEAGREAFGSGDGCGGGYVLQALGKAPFL